LPFSSDVVFTSEMAASMAKALWLTLVALSPALYVLHHWPDAWPLQLLMLALGTAVAPASLLAEVVSRSSLNLLWPIAWYQVVAQAPEAYAQLLLRIIGALLVWVPLTLLLNWLLVPLGWFAMIVTPFVHTGFVLWVAMLFGQHLQANGEEYGLLY
jgi:hypothetical protein